MNKDTTIVVLKIRQWELRERGGSNVKHYVIHLGCDKVNSYGGVAWIPSDAYIRCYGCGASVPDEIQTVIVMLMP